jgi:hypothetical protein
MKELSELTEEKNELTRAMKVAMDELATYQSQARGKRSELREKKGLKTFDSFLDLSVQLSKRRSRKRKKNLRQNFKRR